MHGKFNGAEGKSGNGLTVAIADMAKFCPGTARGSAVCHTNAVKPQSGSITIASSTHLLSRNLTPSSGEGAIGLHENLSHEFPRARLQREHVLPQPT